MPDEFAQLFLKYDYAETKDLSKQFLTLVVAVLVFSLTFSEKIVDFQRASYTTKALLVAAWSCFIGAIILCGLGLVYISLAGGAAAYGQSGYVTIAERSYTLIVIAGSAFVLGLICLIATAIASVFRSTHLQGGTLPGASAPALSTGDEPK